MPDEYTTIRIRKDVLEKIDAICERSKTAPIPAKTSRTDVIAAAVEALELLRTSEPQWNGNPARRPPAPEAAEPKRRKGKAS